MSTLNEKIVNELQLSTHYPNGSYSIDTKSASTSIELIILQMIGDAFDAGVTLGRDYELSGGCPVARNKEDYINNLLNP